MCEVLTKSGLSFMYKMIREIISKPKVDSGYPLNFMVNSWDFKDDESKLMPKPTADIECVHFWSEVRSWHGECTHRVRSRGRAQCLWSGLSCNGKQEKGKKLLSCILLTLPIVTMRKVWKSRVWQKQWLVKCEKFDHMSLLKELRENNPDDFQNDLRMDSACFHKLLKNVLPFLTKQDTSMRPSICAEERLVTTIRCPPKTGSGPSEFKFES